MLVEISAKAEEEMKQTCLCFQREFCSVHARNISLFPLGPCGYIYVTLDHDPEFYDCYFWGAVIIPDSICSLFLTNGAFLVLFLMIFFFFLSQQSCLFCCWFILGGRRPLHQYLYFASVLISTICNSFSALLISETHTHNVVSATLIPLCRGPGEWVHVFGNIRTADQAVAIKCEGD